MKKTALFFTLLGLFLVSVLPAQEYRFREWLDADHFLVSRDGDQLLKVDAHSGRETAYSLPASVDDLLPDSIQATWRNSAYSDDRRQLVVAHAGDLWLASLADKSFRRLTANPAAEHNPTFSPDGRRIAFTRDHNLFVCDLAGGLERQLTTDGAELIYNGFASWVYYEEILGRRSNYQAFYWSPDSRRIAYLRFDDHPVPEFPIFHHEAEDMIHGFLEVTRYPKAGDPPPDVRLGIAEVESGRTIWVDTDDRLIYTAWTFWTPDAGRLFFQQMNRDQDTLRIYTADPATGARTLLYEETQPTWVEWFEKIDFLPENRGFLLRSNRDGWHNIYHYDAQGELVRRLTDFDWRVTEIAEVDAEGGRVFFEGTGDDGTESHLFVVGLDGTGLQLLTDSSGFHRTYLSPGGRYFVDDYSRIGDPGYLALFNDRGERLRTLHDRGAGANAESGIRAELFRIPSTDGFELPASWVLPPDFDPSRRYPVVFSIYGGPDAGTVFNSYRDYSEQSLVNNGVILFAVDHRGSGKFGKRGLDYMHRNLGKWEMHDYIQAVEWLKKQPFVDSTRVGIQGGSYGGYMTALALTYAADHFTHGVSRAPVVDWRLYDNVYTERYMDTPEDNPEGYAFGSVLTHADKLEGELLLVHGTIDDNVHMQNTIQLVSRLQDLGKMFNLMVYPGGRHGWGGAKARHSAKLAENFWLKYFGENGDARP